MARVAQLFDQTGGLHRIDGGQQPARRLRIVEQQDARVVRGVRPDRGGGAVGGKERGAVALRGEGERAVVEGQCGEVDLRAGAGGPADRGEVPGKAEACDIGHGVRAGQDRAGVALRRRHHMQHPHHVAPIGFAGHFRSEDRAGAQRACEDQRIAWPRAVVADGGAVRQAGQREAERHLGPHGGVPADEIRALHCEDFGGRGEDFGERPRLQRLGHARQDDLRQRRLRTGAHGPDVAERMDHGDTREECGVAGEGAQMIGRDDLPGAPDVEDRGVVAGTGEDVGAGRLGQRRQRLQQRTGGHLGAAAGAHRLGGGIAAERHDGGRFGRGHRRQVGELRHERSVDVVLPAPEERPREGEAALVGER